MSEDELRTVAEAHTGLRELAFRLGRELRLRAPALKAAIRAEEVVFRLKRELEQLDLENPELPRRRDPEVLVSAEGLLEVECGGAAKELAPKRNDGAELDIPRHRSLLGSQGEATGST